jgi:hypothetical protein
MKTFLPFAWLALALLLQSPSRPAPAPAELLRVACAPSAAGCDPAWLDGDGRAYFHRDGIAFPRARSGRRLSFTCPFSGLASVSLTCWSERGGVARLIVSGAPDRAPCHARAVLQPGLNQLRFSFPAVRRRPISIHCSATCVFAPPLVYREVAAPQRRNVFLIVADNLGAGHMSCYGYFRKTTPAIDGFCRDALRVTHAYAHSPWTLPSLMSLFSSLPETEHGVRFQIGDEMAAAAADDTARLEVFPLERRHPFLVENMSAAFPAFSFNGGINVAAAFGFFRGFDLVVESPGDYLDPSAASRLFARTQAQLQAHPLPRAFYFLHTYQVHLPYQPSPRALARIAAKNSLRTVDYEKDLGGIRRIFCPPARHGSGEVRALYDAEILDFDRAFGAFIEFLKSRRLYDSSLIVLTADHGEEFFEHGSWAHGTNLFNAQLQVPLIIKFPYRQHAGRTFPGPAGLMDVMPTLLDYLGLPRDAGCRGSSLMREFAAGPAADRSVPAALLLSKHWSLIPGQAALIQGRYKLIRSWPAGPGAGRFFLMPPPTYPDYQLFDMVTDPNERRDIRRQHAPLATRMAARLERMLQDGSGKTGPGKAGRSAGSDRAIDRLRALGYLP